MNYWVALTREELLVCLALLEKKGLPGVVTLDQEFQPEPALLDDMVKKNFFQNRETGRDWNPFVHFLLWNAANARAQLHLKHQNGSIYVLFLREDVMVFLAKETEDDHYVFYFTPYIPQAVGGIAKHLEGLESQMESHKETLDLSLTLPQPAANAEDLLALARSKEPQLLKNPFTLLAEGILDENRTLIAALVSSEDGFLFLRQEEESISCKSIDYYKLIQDLSEWLISTHGTCIKEGEYYGKNQH